MRVGRTVGLTVVVALLGAALVQAEVASAQVDEDRLGIRVTWSATRVDRTQDVRVRVRIFNSAETGTFRGVCRIRVWNSRDAEVEAFPVVIRPGQTIQRRFHVVLEGATRVRAEVSRCRAS